MAKTCDINLRWNSWKYTFQQNLTEKCIWKHYYLRQGNVLLFWKYIINIPWGQDENFHSRSCSLSCKTDRNWLLFGNWTCTSGAGYGRPRFWMWLAVIYLWTTLALSTRSLGLKTLTYWNLQWPVLLSFTTDIAVRTAASAIFNSSNGDNSFNARTMWIQI